MKANAAAYTASRGKAPASRRTSTRSASTMVLRSLTIRDVATVRPAAASAIRTLAAARRDAAWSGPFRRGLGNPYRVPHRDRRGLGNPYRVPHRDRWNRHQLVPAVTLEVVAPDSLAGLVVPTLCALGALVALG